MAEHDESHPAAQPPMGDGAEGHGKEEKKEKGPLESLVSESWSLLKKTALVGATAAIPFVFSIPSTPLYNPQMSINAAVNAIPLAGGAMLDDIMAKKPVDYKKALRESAVGTLLTPPLVGLFGGINKGRDYITNNYGSFAGNAAAVGSLAAGQAAFVGGYHGIDHILSKYSFKGLYDRFKKDYWPTLKRTWKYVLPLSMWNVLYIYKFGMLAQLAYGSLMSLLFRIVGPKSEGASLGNLFRAMNPLPLISTTYNLGVKAVKNTFSSVYQGAYGIGAAISSLFASLTPKPGLSAPKPAERPEADNAGHSAHGYVKSPYESKSKYIPFPSQKTEQKYMDRKAA